MSIAGLSSNGLRRSLAAFLLSCLAQEHAPESTTGGFTVVNRSVAAQWAMLGDHFQHHAKIVDRFRHAGPEAVLRMWLSDINEYGESPSQFERDALVERHCELFGTCPD